jgi:hypothetical protein
MFSLIVGIIISGSLFLLGVYASYKMQQAANQFVLQYHQGQATPSPRPLSPYLTLL